MTKIRDVSVEDVTKWTIIGDRYLLEVVEASDTLVGSILIPDSGEMRRGWSLGRVVNMGHKGEHAHRLDADVRVPMFFNVGDMLVVERLAGKDFLVGGKKYRLVNQVDVLARLED